MLLDEGLCALRKRASWSITPAWFYSHLVYDSSVLYNSCSSFSLICLFIDAFARFLVLWNEEVQWPSFRCEWDEFLSQGSLELNMNRTKLKGELDEIIRSLLSLQPHNISVAHRRYTRLCLMSWRKRRLSNWVILCQLMRTVCHEKTKRIKLLRRTWSQHATNPPWSGFQASSERMIQDYSSADCRVSSFVYKTRGKAHIHDLSSASRFKVKCAMGWDKIWLELKWPTAGWILTKQIVKMNRERPRLRRSNYKSGEQCEKLGSSSYGKPKASRPPIVPMSREDG